MTTPFFSPPTPIHLRPHYFFHPQPLSFVGFFFPYFMTPISEHLLLAFHFKPNGCCSSFLSLICISLFFWQDGLFGVGGCGVCGGLRRVGGGGVVNFGGAAVLVLARTRCWGAFWVRLLMGSGGGIYVDGDKIMARCADQVRRVTKGTNAPRPVSITRPGKVTWRAWPATTLRSQWSSQAIAILHLVLVAAVLCRILGSVGVGGRGWSFPPRAASSH